MSGEPRIVACTDGPLLVRGDFELVSSSGEPIPRTRRTVALCRCGVSAIKPFCDGTHKLVKFRTGTPAPEPGAEAAPNERAASEPAAHEPAANEHPAS